MSLLLLIAFAFIVTGFAGFFAIVGFGPAFGLGTLPLLMAVLFAAGIALHVIHTIKTRPVYWVSFIFRFAAIYIVSYILLFFAVPFLILGPEASNVLMGTIISAVGFLLPFLIASKRYPVWKQGGRNGFLNVILLALEIYTVIHILFFFYHMYAVYTAYGGEIPFEEGYSLGNLLFFLP